MDLGGEFLIDLDFIARLQGELGLDFVDARVQYYYSELVVYDNGVVRDFVVNSVQGVGVRVVYKGYVAYSSTSSLEKSAVRDAVLRAFKLAKASSKYSLSVDLYARRTVKDSLESTYTVDPENVDFSEKVELLRDMYNCAREVRELSSITLRYGFEKDKRVYVSSNGDYVEFTRRMIGASARLVASVEGAYETLYDSESAVAGWEFIKSINWSDWVKERAKLVVEAARAERVKPGRYDVVLDNDMVGLMLHEAFGHASEGDIVLAGGSILGGRIGEKVASDLVSIVDDGLVEGGVLVPYDDEGTPKRKTYTVKNGVLVGFLHSLTTAKMLKQEPTGNARVMSYQDPILVRQTNTYMEPGDWSVEEMIKDTRRGLYVRGRGALGGQVNPLTGAFTFTSGPSYLIENGELKQLVKGVMLSGLILETLKNVDAVGRDLVVRTSVFGGCGKGGQTVRVGDGGPHVRVRGFTIGGG
ncbi:MAG: TldD/PmbA family protein [Desulfurococcaceae archaeon]